MSHGGKLAAKALKAAGVECIFTLSGGHVMAIYDGCLDENIKVVDVRHEQAAVHAADAWARLHPGTVGVAVLTAGPGATDGVTGIANAWRANSPILVIGGQGPLGQLRRGSLQEMDHVSVMRPITKWADAVYDTDRIAEFIELGIRHALAGTPGPAYLEIPIDVLSGGYNEERARVITPARPPRLVPEPALIEEAVHLLAEAQRPLLMAGTAVKWSEGGAALNRFLEKVKLPGYANGMGRGQIPHDSPYFFNRTRRDALEQADCVVLAGTVLDFRMRYGDSIPADAKIIQLDMDGTLIGQNRPSDVGLVGNLGLIFDAMCDVIDTKELSLDWSARCAELRAKEQEADIALQAQLTSDEVPIDPQRLCKEIAEFVGDDDIVIGDGGDIVAKVAKVLRIPKNGFWMDPGPLGTLGVGMPFALAAQLSYPDKRVLIVYGDGSFGLNGFEFDTAVRFNLPIVGIVGNDAAWGQMMRPQYAIYGEDRVVATRLQYTRYDKVVEALGGHAEHVTKPDEIQPALERAFASGKPACVNVVMRQDVAFSGGTYI